MPLPPPVTVPVDGIAPPDGSVVENDYQYPIANQYLEMLSTSTKSILLSVSNIGATTTSKIETALQVIDNFTELEPYVLSGSALNSLLNNSQSAAYVVTNVGTSTLVKVIIILGEISPSATTPKMLITNGTTTYELAISSTTNEKRLEFNDIPSSFVGEFYVVNQTGVTLASGGNSIFVISL